MEGAGMSTTSSSTVSARSESLGFVELGALIANGHPLTTQPPSATDHTSVKAYLPC